jgi:autoinducer 2-degrading protein
MIVTLVHVWVKPGNIHDFVLATTENHEKSIQEEGNLRFDLLQDADDPSKFVIYEAYESDQAAAAHKQTAHYKKWREAVADLMAQPRRGDKHSILAPVDPKLW